MSKAQTIRLALVDDHTMFRAGLRSMLDSISGLEVVFEAENGREFLEKDLSSIDLVMMDVEMPVLNGLETMEELQRNGSDISIILLSQNKEPVLISKMMELGARGYLAKDAEPDELKLAIDSVRKTGYYFNDLVSNAMLVKLAGKEQLKPTFNYVEHLSDRETEVLDLICKEMTTSEIADKLFLSPKTVENHRSRIMDKTGVRNTAGLVVFAIKHNLVDVG